LPALAQTSTLASIIGLLVTTSPPTILQVVPELETGGAELSAVEMAAAITENGGRALVVSQGGRLEGDLRAAGGELIRLPVATKNPLIIWRNGLQIAAIAKRERADLLHARSRAPAWSTLIASRQTGIPFITTYHGAYGEKGPVKRAYNQVMVRGRLVIANSKYTAGLIESRYNTPSDQIRVIYRGVDAAFDPARVSSDRKASLRQRWGIDEGRRIVLLAGRLTSWKGQQVLVDAYARLASEMVMENTVVVLAGDHQGRDGYRDGLLEQIKAAGLTDRVHLIGHESDMPAAFGTAHIAVVASTEPEAFGRTAVEAQAMGCPVIATRHGAPPETVMAPPDAASETQTGWLAQPGDAADLAAHMLAALSMSQLDRHAMGLRATAHVHANFTSALMKSKTLLVYNEVLDQNSELNGNTRFSLR